MVGTVIRVFLTRGFGFVRSEGDEQNHFLHARDLPEGEWEQMREGVMVEFTSTTTPNGLRATKARILPSNRKAVFRATEEA